MPYGRRHQLVHLQNRLQLRHRVKIQHTAQRALSGRQLCPTSPILAVLAVNIRVYSIEGMLQAANTHAWTLVLKPHDGTRCATSCLNQNSANGTSAPGAFSAVHYQFDTLVHAFAGSKPQLPYVASAPSLYHVGAVRLLLTD